MGNPVKYIAALVAVLLCGLTVVLVVRATADDSEGNADRQTQCLVATEDVKEEIGRSVEGEIWKAGLFETDRPVPQALKKDGGRLALEQASEEQLGVYLRWKSGNDALEDTMGRAVSDVGDVVNSAWVDVMRSCRSEEGQEKCGEAVDNGRAEVARAVEAATWQYGIYRKNLTAPDGLMESADGQNRIPLGELSPNQLAAYQKWKRKPAYKESAGRLIQDINDANAQKWQSMSEGCSR